MTARVFVTKDKNLGIWLIFKPKRESLGEWAEENEGVMENKSG